MPVDNEPEIFASDKNANFAEVTKLALDRGLAIHPCHPRSKEPWLKAWQKQASRDPQVVAEWARRFPTSNYGVAANDEFMILESDDVDRLRELLGVPIPPTYTVLARPGRPHFYFKQTAESKSAGNMDLPGIFEFKQNGRYVIGEGSIHPCGATYVRYNNDPIVDIPSELVARLVALRSGSHAQVSGPAPKDGQKFGEGDGRQGYLMRSVAQMWDGEKTREQMIEEAQALNVASCDPLKETHKVVSMVDWIMDKKPNAKGATVIIGKLKLEGEPYPHAHGAFDFVMGPQEGQFEGAFALGSVHLISGSSGAGKSTFGNQLLREQFHGHQFFERETYRRPFLVVVQDRTELEMARTDHRMGFETGSIPRVAVSPAQASKDPGCVIEEIYLTQEVKPQIIFIEGLDLWCADALDMRKVSLVMGNLQTFALHYHVSVIGTVGAPKMKPKDRYASPRDRSYGSSAWPRRADTILDFSVDEETQDRNVWLLLRNAPPQHYTLRFVDGLLVIANPTCVVGEDRWTTKSVMEKFGVKERTAQGWIKEGRVPRV